MSNNLNQFNDNSTITTKDHLVRLHLLSCCIADKAESLSQKIKYGLSCEKDKIILQLLVAYYDILKCYNPEYPSRSYGSFRLAKNSTNIIGETVEVYVDGILIASVTANSNSLYDLLVLILNEINNTVTTPENYTATFDGVDTITIYSTSTDDSINGYVVSVISDPDYIISFDIQNMQEGNDLDNPNCLNTNEVKKIWDHVSKLCNLCFAPYKSNYINPSLTDSSIFNFSKILQEDGNYILQENNDFIKTEK